MGSQSQLERNLLALQPSAYRVALWVLGDGAEAEDAVQEAYLRAWRDRAAVQGELRPWLLSVVANTARERRRAEERRMKREDVVTREKAPAAPPGPAEAALRAEAAAHLRTALVGLDERLRLPLLLHHVEGLSHEEAAAVLDLPEATCRKYASRAIERLRESLTAAGLSAAAPIMFESLKSVVWAEAPAGLSAKLVGVMAQSGAGVGSTSPAAAAALVAKGGLAMKIILGVVGAGVLAGAVAIVNGVGAQHAAPLQSPPPAGQPAKDRIIPLAFLTGWMLETQDGPALSAAASCHSPMVLDNVGNIYLIDAAQQQIFLFVREENRVYTLCSGGYGYRDGPAGEAQFGSVFHDEEVPVCAIDAKNRLIFSDSRSGTLRMIERRPDGQYWFSTILGGGKRKPDSIKPGESVPANEVAKIGRSVLAFARDGTDAIYLNVAWAGNFKLADGKLTRLPCERFANALNMDVDAEGNIYMVDGNRSFYSKIGKDGKAVFLGGARNNQSKGLVPPDAPPLLSERTGKDGPMIQATFWCPATCWLSADGKSLYIGGGDEASVRRVTPIDPQGRTSTLMTDATWKECEYHGEKGQWMRPPGIHGKTGLCLAVGTAYMWEHSYHQALINLIEGPQVDLVRKAFGTETGGGK